MDNPFSTRYTRPGAIPFFFPPGWSAKDLVQRLRANRWHGEIVGPHGSGKSTLLAALIPELCVVGRPPFLIELHDGQRSLPVDLGNETRGDDVVVIIDGYEQLSFWSRARLKRFCRRRGYGLVVSSHQPTGLPLLFQTDVNPALVERIVRHLLGEQATLIKKADLECCFLRHGGNLREMLFELYDHYERCHSETSRTDFKPGGESDSSRNA